MGLLSSSNNDILRSIAYTHFTFVGFAWILIPGVNISSGLIDDQYLDVPEMCPGQTYQLSLSHTEVPATLTNLSVHTSNTCFYFAFKLDLQSLHY